MKYFCKNDNLEREAPEGVNVGCPQCNQNMVPAEEEKKAGNETVTTEEKTEGTPGNETVTGQDQAGTEASAEKAEEVSEAAAGAEEEKKAGDSPDPQGEQAQ